MAKHTPPIDGNTRVYGILGNPVHHSLSPVMHNTAFAILGENRVYLPFRVEDVGAALQGLRGLGIHGVSVTIPHKENVMNHLDRIDPVAAKIGAVNTISCETVDERKLLCGYNTDWLGAVSPLARFLDLQGEKAVILGAGGSARAIGFGLLQAGASITLCSRTAARGRALAELLQCPWCALEDVGELQGRILINATSVGMAPQGGQSPVAAVVAAGYEVVMDIVYSPLKTQLLSDAEAGGSHTINGLEMLLYQGVAQFELWTNREAPVEDMRRALLRAVAAE
ncbi:MAG: shikimate dehydrogenase [Desulfopila sp.]